MRAFLDSLDIANRALDHCGEPSITSVSEDSVRNDKVSRVYDPAREAELERNVWHFAIKSCILRPIETTTLLLDPPSYSASAVYLTGQIVQNANGVFWISVAPDNSGNTPGGDNETWETYYGPRTVHLYSSTTTYNRGELVYNQVDPASYEVYMSLADSNSDDPTTSTAWDATVYYYRDQVVSYAADNWRCIVPYSIDVTPADASTDWTRTPTITASAKSWRPLGSTSLKSLDLLYPTGAGPLSDTSSRNIFYLPSGFLRLAPQDPKAGSTSSLGAPSNLPYLDWNLEDQFLTSDLTGPMVFRFVANHTKVRTMSTMFCEGLACRIALSVCEPLTQSSAKLKNIAAEYEKFMSDARMSNAILIGTEEPPLDDWIACRA